MNQLEEAVQTILTRLKNELSDETWISRRRCFNQLLKLADKMHITEPCQKLYDAFIAEDNGSPERRGLHIHCVRLLDEISETHALNKNGGYFNEKPLPNEQNVVIFFHDRNFPLCDPISLGYIIVKAKLEMKYLQLSESTTGQYMHAWLEIQQYFEKRGFDIYSPEILNDYICSITVSHNSGLIKEWKWKINRKAAFALAEVAKTGHYKWASISNGLTYPLPSDIDIVKRAYCDFLTDRNLSASTVYLHDFVFHRFIYFAHISTAEELCNYTPGQAADAVSEFAKICSSRSLSVILPIFRSILKKLFTDGKIKRNVSGAVLNNYLKRGHLPVYLVKSDELIILNQLEHESRRTKAILLLAFRLGLRDSDICGLRFDEIDWQHDRLTVTQSKTGVHLVLPLLTDVGNAIMDYIENERHAREDRYPYVFLRLQAPYNKLSSAYPSCSKVLNKIGITPVNGKCKGIHLFRYSLVHRLLEAKVPHRVITDTLGHTSGESDKPYLSMEDSMLQLCALDLSLIGKISWKQADI
jgi:integrase